MPKLASQFVYLAAVFALSFAGSRTVEACDGSVRVHSHPVTQTYHRSHYAVASVRTYRSVPHYNPVSKKSNHCYTPVSSPSWQTDHPDSRTSSHIEQPRQLKTIKRVTPISDVRTQQSAPAQRPAPPQTFADAAETNIAPPVTDSDVNVDPAPPIASN